MVAKTIAPEPARTFVHVFEDEDDAKRCDENASSSFASRGLSNDWCSAILCNVCVKNNSLSLLVALKKGKQAEALFVCQQVAFKLFFFFVFVFFLA